MKSSKIKESADSKRVRLESGNDAPGEFNLEIGSKMVNVELPIWVIKALDQEASRRGIARQPLIKMWIVDRLDSIHIKKEGLA